MTVLQSGPCALHGTAFGVAQDEDGLASGVLGGVLEARDEIGRSHVPGDAGDEQVTGGRVEDLFHRGPAVDAGQDRGVGILPGGGTFKKGTTVARGGIP